MNRKVTHDASHPEALVERPSFQRISTQPFRSSTAVFALLVSAVATLIGATLYSTLTAQRMALDHSRLARASITLRLELTLGHLWFEEVVIGDSNESMETISAHNARARLLARAMLNGGDTFLGPIRALEEPHSREHVVELLSRLEQYERRMLERHRSTDSVGAGTAVDQMFDGLFRELLELAEEIEGDVDDITDSEVQAFYVTQGVVLGGSLLILFAAFIFLYRSIRERQEASQQQSALLNELEGKNEELESIVYAASHDLRSPLVNVQGFAKELSLTCGDLRSLLDGEAIPDKLRTEVMSLIDEDIEESLSFIGKNATKMDQLLKGLLRLSRLGRASVNFKLLDMNELVKGVIETLSMQISENGVAVEVGELPRCYADETQISQVFTNLIDNAIKYREPEREGLVVVSGAVRGGTCVYCVEDNGIGMQEAHLAKVFQLFHRLDPKGAVTGDGLGLTIVHRIIARHEGKIWIESKEGVGSQVFVELALTE